MTRGRAWMIDVYETAVSVDFDAVWQGLSDLAAVPVADFRSAADAHIDRVMTGALSLREAFDAALANVRCRSRRVRRGRSRRT